jgi:hypothetical protein
VGCSAAHFCNCARVKIKIKFEFPTPGTVHPSKGDSKFQKLASTVLHESKYVCAQAQQLKRTEPLGDLVSGDVTPRFLLPAITDGSGE